MHCHTKISCLKSRVKYQVLQPSPVAIFSFFISANSYLPSPVQYCLTLKQCIGLDWIGLDWIGLDWIGLDWIGLDWIGLYCIVLYCIVLYCIVLYCIVLYCIVLYYVLPNKIRLYSFLCQIFNMFQTLQICFFDFLFSQAT